MTQSDASNPAFAGSAVPIPPPLPPVAAIPVDPLSYYAPQQTGITYVYRQGKQLVVAKEVTLPPVCVKCNAPGEPVHGKFSWYNPLYALLILAGVLIFVIVALIVTKRGNVVYCLCRMHRAKHRNNVVLAWLFFGLSIVSFILCGVFDSPWPAIPGAILLILACIWAIAFVPTLRAKQIDDHYIWLSGACPEYLNQFPTFGPWAG